MATKTVTAIVYTRFIVDKIFPMVKQKLTLWDVPPDCVQIDEMIVHRIVKDSFAKKERNKPYTLDLKRLDTNIMKRLPIRVFYPIDEVRNELKTSLHEYMSYYCFTHIIKLRGKG
ncbi:MAG: hypothetical protein FWB88_07170 [Defluviitaleaceae bacterium]|nr:hypothetical protein [Defluviitaleaceae bacterium]MCL2239351.1 hypothetical protein [Defluviitaleaceae bacterium]